MSREPAAPSGKPPGQSPSGNPEDPEPGAGPSGEVPSPSAQQAQAGTSTPTSSGERTRPLGGPDAPTRPMPGPGAHTADMSSGVPLRAMQSGESELVIGSVLAERYQVLERLSAGGMGVVYKARHVALDDLVAVKILLKPQKEEDQRRFLLEARLATKIKHPNTVYISDFGVLPDGRSYLAMEFLQGKPLANAVKDGPIEPLRACRIAVQIARGLQAVHDKGVVHRDT